MLTLNSIAFRPPNKITRYDNRADLVVENYGQDGSLLVDIISYTPKERRDLIFDTLTSAEFAQIKLLDRTGTYPVIIDDVGYEYSATSFIRVSGANESAGGRKTDVKVTIIEV